ncbi:MAG: UDP-N-acetylmuramoyl-tripeptide--D-alanyl-D-alanine ligase [Candidatus Omnitrophica bacterium]|nr:UDP-N-acetylmuramoyl-tripeptide--D-alanyl-D-alanine ligase [Candidatus Omnitrophota bacterium]
MLTINEILKATRGTLVRGQPRASVRGVSIDSRNIKRGEAFIALRGERFDGHDFIPKAVRRGARCIIAEAARVKKSAGGACALITVADTTKALGDLARLIRDKSAIPLIAVTGSNGKTTAKEMISWVLSSRYRVLKNEGTKNNHIGVPLTLFKLKKEHDLAVLELGTNHFGEIAYLAEICRPTVGVLTAIGPAHLESFGNIKGVFREKWSLFGLLKAPAIGILNADAPFVKKYAASGAKGKFFVGAGMGSACDFKASDVVRGPGGLAFSVNKKYRFTLRTHGYYNIYNALLAVSIGRIFGLGYPEIARRLSSFVFPPGRLTCIEANKIRIFDDTYNANPASLGQALEALRSFSVKGKKILVMGDMLELGKSAGSFHRRAGREAAGVCDKLVTVGKLSRLAAAEARRAGLNAKDIIVCRDSGQAARVMRHKGFLSAGDAVLVKGSRRMQLEKVIHALSSPLPVT